MNRRRQVAERVEQVDRDERARPRHVHEAATDDPADADAEVEQREVDAEVALALLGRDEVADERARRRPHDAEAVAHEHERHGRLPGRRRERQQDVGDEQRDEAARIDPTRSDPVDERPRRRDEHDAHAGLERQQQAHRLERDAAHLVEVDDHERQDEARADRLEDDGRDEQLALARQVVPERGQPRSGRGRAGRAHRGSLPCRTDSRRPPFEPSPLAPATLPSRAEGVDRPRAPPDPRRVSHRGPSPDGPPLRAALVVSNPTTRDVLWSAGFGVLSSRSGAVAVGGGWGI